MMKKISSQHLHKLIGFEQVPTATLDKILPQITLEHFDIGDELIKPDEPIDDTLYLLEGHIQQIKPDNFTAELNADNDACKYPIAVPDQAPQRIIATTPVTIAHIPTRIIKRLTLEKSISIEVDESGIFDNELQNTIFTQFFKDYQQDKIKLPSLPDIALKVRKAIQDPNISLHTITKIISLDPAIAARVTQVANSPAFRGTSAISCCHGAITRLGLKMTQQLVTSFTMHQLFKSTHPTLVYKMNHLWQHAKSVAAVSYILAKHSRRLEPDIAMLAGLIHEIGAVAIIQHAEKYACLIQNTQHFNDTIRSLKATIGAMILQSWHFDEQLVTVVAEADNWNRKHHGKADYADLVQVAKLHCYFGQKPEKDFPTMTEVPAFIRLTKGKLTPQKSLDIMAQAKTEILTLESLL